MKQPELERMSVEDLWKLHVEIGESLAKKLSAEKEVLEDCLTQLHSKPNLDSRIATPERRKYPPVLPKFRNPNDPSETWSGRGKPPRWLAHQLETGRSIDEFKSQMAAE